jgi:hypothetical protein
LGQHACNRIADTPLAGAGNHRHFAVFCSVHLRSSAGSTATSPLTREPPHSIPQSKRLPYRAEPTGEQLGLHGHGLLAWSLKAWAALLVPVHGRWAEKHTREKRQLLRTGFATFRNALTNIPAQMVRTGRKIVHRILEWNPWQPVFFRLLDQLRQPLRC